MKTAKTNKKYYNSEIPSNSTHSKLQYFSIKTATVESVHLFRDHNQQKSNDISAITSLS